MAVSIGNHPEGKCSSIRLVGSWSAITSKLTRSAANDLDAFQDSKSNVDPVIAAAQSMAM